MHLNSAQNLAVPLLFPFNHIDLVVWTRDDEDNSDRRNSRTSVLDMVCSHFALLLSVNNALQLGSTSCCPLALSMLTSIAAWTTDTNSNNTHCQEEERLHLSVCMHLMPHKDTWCVLHRFCNSCLQNHALRLNFFLSSCHFDLLVWTGYRYLDRIGVYQIGEDIEQLFKYNRHLYPNSPCIAPPSYIIIEQVLIILGDINYVRRDRCANRTVIYFCNHIVLPIHHILLYRFESCRWLAIRWI